MNGKTVKKLLMKGRVTNFWGRRAYLTVRLPLLSVISTPTPEPLTFEGMPVSDPVSGVWHNEDYSDVINISRVHLGRKPVSRHAFEPVYFAQKNSEHDGYEMWSYWTGARHKTLPERTDDGETHERTPIDEATVARHKAFREWHDNLHKYGHHPLLDALLEAGEYAKSTSFDIKGENLLVTFGVKWFYPSRKYRFSAGIARASRLAARLGIPLRVIQT